MHSGSLTVETYSLEMLASVVATFSYSCLFCYFVPGFEKDGQAGKCIYLSKDGKVRYATAYYCYCADTDQLEYKWTSKSCGPGWLTYTAELCRSKNSGSSVYRVGGLKGSGSSRKCYAAYLKPEHMTDYDRLCYREKGACTAACAKQGMHPLNAGNTGRHLCRSYKSSYYYGKLISAAIEYIFGYH